MKQKIEEKKLKKYIENFINSDAPSATVGKFLLMTLALGGIAFTGALVPSLLCLIEKYRQSENYTEKQIQNAVYNFKKRKLIEIIQQKDNTTKVCLTNKGMKRFKEFSLETLLINKPARWDHRWRVLIFDIPTKPKLYNLAREALRNKIKELGFYQMQKSTWVYPYECEDEILFIAEAFEVQKYIEILTVEKLLHQEKLKKFFKL